MRRFSTCVAVLASFMGGCVLGSSGGSDDNPYIAGEIDYCPARCLKFQECNTDLFNLKWGTLDACEKECNPWTEPHDCVADCDTTYAAGTAEYVDCAAYCKRTVTVADCQAQCEGISDDYYHTQCMNGCTASFSQACADVWADIHECYLGLECDRVVLYKDFGGSASALGECNDDDGVSASCR